MTNVTSTYIAILKYNNLTLDFFEKRFLNSDIFLIHVDTNIYI
jgi:hypothetical protein